MVEEIIRIFPHDREIFKDPEKLRNWLLVV